MPHPQTVHAIVLSTIRYGESSRIARLATRELGVQHVIAKGAARPRSRIGGALQFLSEGQAMLLLSRSGDLHTLTAFDVIRAHGPLGERLDRFAVGAALAEVMLRFAPPAPCPAAWELLHDALALLDVASGDVVDTLGLRMIWRLVSVLGYEPAVEVCARDGATLPGDVPVTFSMTDGGVLCARCGSGHAGAHLRPADRADLVALLDPDADLPALDRPHEAAHRRLLARWIRTQQGDGLSTPAVDFFEQRPWEPAA